MDRAAEFLPPEHLASLVTDLQQRADATDDRFAKRSVLHHVEAIARQTCDATLFEQVRLQTSPEPVPVASCVDLARQWLSASKPERALQWLERIADNQSFRAPERDELLLATYQALGRADDAGTVAWRIFRRHRTVAGLQTLRQVIGDDDRDRSVADEVALITGDAQVSLSDAGFLLAVGRATDASDYLLARHAQLNGDLYSSLLPLADAFEREGYVLATSAIYRALLDSILRRANSRYYHHAVRYLRKLDALQHHVCAWSPLSEHEAYQQQLRDTHGRKRSFWRRYETGKAG